MRENNETNDNVIVIVFLFLLRCDLIMWLRLVLDSWAHEMLPFITMFQLCSFISPKGRLHVHQHVNHVIPSPASSVTMVKVAVLLATPYTRPGPYADTLPLLG